MSREYSPEVIAQSFIKQFYEMLAKNPAELHRFYKEDSSFSHAEGHQITKSVTGTENIRECVNMLQLLGARLDLSEGSMDAQRSDNNGVFLLVTGFITMPGKSRRQFSQSFFLACQSGSTNQKTGMASYFVRNSVFRLLGADEPAVVESVAVSAPVAQPAPTTSTAAQAPPADVIDTPVPTAAPAVPEVVETPVEEQPTVEEPVEDTDNVDATTVMSEPEYVNVSLRSGEEGDAVVVMAESMTPSVPAVAKSFADLVKSWSPPDENASASAASNGTKIAAKKTKKPAAASPAEAKSNTATAPTTTASLFVNQIPENTVEADLVAVFESFGAIKKIDVHPRGYAFVDFQDKSAVANALAQLTANGPFTIGGSPIHVEERQAKSSSANGKSGGGRGGRGGGERGSGGRVHKASGAPRKDGNNNKRLPKK